MSRITTRRFALWWSLAKVWLNNKFSSIQFDTSTLATKAAQTAQTAQLTTLQQRLGISGEVVETLQAALQGNDTSATLAALKTLIAAIPTTQISGYALQGTDPTATNTKILEEIATASSQVNLIEITSAQITAMINRIITN